MALLWVKRVRPYFNLSRELYDTVWSPYESII